MNEFVKLHYYALLASRVPTKKLFIKVNWKGGKILHSLIICKGNESFDKAFVNSYIKSKITDLEQSYSAYYKTKYICTNYEIEKSTTNPYHTYPKFLW